MKVLKFAIIGLLLQAGAAAAADRDDRFAMKGAGFLPCAVYSKARGDRSDIYYMIGGWIEGYLSAHNRYVEDTYDIMSFESLELLLKVMETHCKANPTHRLHGVLNAMIAALSPDRLRRESPKVRITDGARKTALYRETVRRLQSELSQRGLYKNDVDGRYTEDTKSALMAYQSDLAFEPTGFPDQSTLWRLLRK